jgi:hypothetical protein
MLYEFETGHPPFQGTTVNDIARQHIEAPPPHLGGFFRRTTLGLENVVARCLQKNPLARYATYAELESALIEIARKRGFSLERCASTARYERSPLGMGREVQDALLGEPGVLNTGGYGFAEFERVASFFEEAENLIALRRFNEAEALLRPHFIRQVLNGDREWHFGHSIALNYAHCLVNMRERLDEGLDIFRSLDRLTGKPAEYYVNHSLGLLERPASAVFGSFLTTSTCSVIRRLPSYRTAPSSLRWSPLGAAFACGEISTASMKVSWSCAPLETGTAIEISLLPSRWRGSRSSYSTMA